MAIKIERDGITFSSGRTLYANRGIVGIAPDLEISEGYDGHIYWPPIDGGDADSLTAADMADPAVVALSFTVHKRSIDAKAA